MSCVGRAVLFTVRDSQSLACLPPWKKRGCAEGDRTKARESSPPPRRLCSLPSPASKVPNHSSQGINTGDALCYSTDIPLSSLLF